MGTKITIPNGKGKIVIDVNEKNDTATITLIDEKGGKKTYQLKNLKKSKDGTVITADGPWWSDIKITLKKEGNKYFAIVEVDAPGRGNDRKDKIVLTKKQYDEYVACIKKLKIPIDQKLAALFKPGSPRDQLARFARRIHSVRQFWGDEGLLPYREEADGLTIAYQPGPDGSLQVQLHIAPDAITNFSPELTAIEGIGPKTADLLREQGIQSLEQLAEWPDQPAGLGETEWAYFQQSAAAALDLRVPLSMQQLSFEDVEVIVRIYGDVARARAARPCIRHLHAKIEEEQVQLPAEYQPDALAEWLHSI